MFRRSALRSTAAVFKGLLLDFYGTVVEDDDAIIAAIAGQVAAGAASPVTAGEVLAAWIREFEAVACGPSFVPLRRCSPVSLATVIAVVGCPGDPAALCAP